MSNRASKEDREDAIHLLEKQMYFTRKESDYIYDVCSPAGNVTVENVERLLPRFISKNVFQLCQVTPTNGFTYVKIVFNS